MGDDEGSGRGIQSVETACQILRVLEAAEGPMAAREIAGTIGMAPNKVRFYLISLLREGLVTQDGATGPYALGPFAIQLGLTALRQADLVALSRRALQALSGSTRLSAFLSIWSQRGPIIAAKSAGLYHSPIYIRVGNVLPLTTSATGQVFHAFQPPQETAAIVALEQPGGPWAMPGAESPEAMAAGADGIRAQGYATSHDRLYQGFSSIAAPILNAESDMVGSLTLIGPSTAFSPPERTKALVGQLLAQADEIADMLGRTRHKAGRHSKVTEI